MAKFLIVYGSKQGQAGKIGKAIGDEIRRHQQTADVYDADNIPKDLSLNKYDVIVAGGGVHLASYPRKLKKWIMSHSNELKDKPSAFYSVCLGVLQDDPRVQEEVKNIPQTFFQKTGWKPWLVSTFAGALMYSKYNWILKRVMRSIARRAGTITDLNQDYEYTNWDDVKKFAYQVERLATT